jgi:hypothetical protein
VTRGKLLHRLERAEHVARKVMATSPDEVDWPAVLKHLTSVELERLRDLLAGLVAAEGDPPLGTFTGERPEPLERTPEAEAEYASLLQTARERQARGEKPDDEEARKRSRSWWRPRVRRDGAGYDVVIGAQSLALGFDPTAAPDPALTDAQRGVRAPEPPDLNQVINADNLVASDPEVPEPTPAPLRITGPAKPPQDQEPAPPGRAWRRQGDRPDELRDRIERWAF